MARTFRRQRTMQPIADLNVTNMIDLGFTLLIIFMIASTVIQQEQTLPVDLPTSSNANQTKQPTAVSTVYIRTNGTFLIGDRTVTLAELSREFTRLADTDDPPAIRIRSDAKAPMELIFKVMEEMQKNGLKKIGIDYKVVN